MRDLKAFFVGLIERLFSRAPESVRPGETLSFWCVHCARDVPSILTTENFVGVCPECVAFYRGIGPDPVLVGRSTPHEATAPTEAK